MSDIPQDKYKHWMNFNKGFLLCFQRLQCFVILALFCSSETSAYLLVLSSYMSVYFFIKKKLIKKVQKWGFHEPSVAFNAKADPDMGSTGNGFPHYFNIDFPSRETLIEKISMAP